MTYLKKYFVQKLLVLSVMVKLNESLDIHELNNNVENSENLSKSLEEVKNFNNDIQQKYRSLGLLDDFSIIVNNMIKSLQEVQTRGEEMVKKIRTQEAKLEKITKQISDKEEHIRKVNSQMKQIKDINLRIEKEVNNTEVKKQNVQKEIRKLEEKQESLKSQLTTYSQAMKNRKIEEEREMKKFKALTETKSQGIER